MTTLYQQHVERWSSCDGCILAEQRARVVLARGQVPCDVLFVGEAPGDSEDALGWPFAGPAGHLMDSIIDQAELNGGAACPPTRYALTNLVACFPREAKETGENEPPMEAVLACRERLDEFIRMCAPRLLVCVGSLAQDWLSPNASKRGERWSWHSIRQVGIVHPGAILRGHQVARQLMIRRAVVQLAKAVEQIERS